VDAIGGQTTFSYDANSNLLSLTDALSHATSYGYDASDRVATRTDPLTHQASYAYDGNDNLTQTTDRKNQVTSRTYDPLDRPKVVTFADTSTITYTYDAGDRLTQIADSANGTITRAYDDLDRLTSETTPEGTVSYTYDAAGRRATMTVAGQTAVSYAYDNANRLTSITQGTAVVSFTYDDANRRSTLTYPNGIVATYGYDNANQLTSLSYALGQTTLGDLTYTYDAAGQRISVGGSWARTGLPSSLTSATYDAANRIASWGGTSFTYDSNGNLASDGLTSYAWNARNQLVGMSGGTSASFQYDGLRRRQSKTISGTTTSFLYDALNLVQELSGSTPTANLLTGLGIDETFTRTDGSGTSALVVDALGSTLELADASGTLETHYSYEPFGATTTSGATSTNAQQYTGRENDGTGLYFNRARFYSPVLQRFISEDPLGMAGGSNLFAYAGNIPTSFIDPLGLKPSPCFGCAPGAPRGGNGPGGNGPDERTGRRWARSCQSESA
jgi:RHS repeat-associated protein